MLRTRCTSLHPEAIAWANAVVTNGSAGVSTKTLRAVSTFCADIDRAGIRSLFLRLNLLAGPDLVACRTPLFRGGSRTGTQYGGATDTNNGPFVAGDYSESTGLTGNALTKYLDTGLTMTTLTTFGMSIDNDHISAYVRSGATTNGAYAGAIDAGELPTACALLDTSGKTEFFSGDPFGDRRASGSRTAYGLFLGQFSSSTAGIVTQNNSDITSIVANNYYYDFTASKVFVFAAADEGGAATYKNAACIAAYSIGKSMTSGQRTSYYNAMLAFQTALGRNV